MKLARTALVLAAAALAWRAFSAANVAGSFDYDVETIRNPRLFQGKLKFELVFRAKNPSASRLKVSSYFFSIYLDGRKIANVDSPAAAIVIEPRSAAEVVVLVESLPLLQVLSVEAMARLASGEWLAFDELRITGQMVGNGIPVEIDELIAGEEQA